MKFFPGKIESLNLTEDVGTAGSIPLILQVLIPVIAVSQKKICLTIKGGTDVLWSPSIDYTNHVLKEAYSKMGIKFSLKIDKRGYYPKGGGEVRLEVSPSQINSIKVTKRKTRDVKLICSFSKIPIDKIKDKVEAITRRLTANELIVKTEIKNENAIDSGASLLVYSTDEYSVIGEDSLFDKKKESFDFDFERFTQNKLGVDENLADMLVVPASIVGEKTIFHVKNITKHLETNLFVTSKITGCRYGIGKLNDGFEIIIEGISNSSIK